MYQELIDQIYECAFVPECWPGVLQSLAKIPEAGGATLFCVNAQSGIKHWTASPFVRDLMEAYVSEGWMTDKERRRPTKYLNPRHPGFLVEDDVCTPEELEKNPTVVDFLRPRGFGWAAISGIQLPTRDWIVFTIEREYTRGPIEAAFIRQLDLLRPHLARTALMSARLQLERARVVTETLALIGLPALVFDTLGKVLAANQLIEAQTTHLRWRARDRVSLMDSKADALFRQAIAALAAKSAAATTSFALRNADGAAAMIAHVIPTCRSAQDIFTSCAAVLVMTPVAMPHAPPVELVQSLFDLTAAEARVARSLAAGETVETIAGKSNVSQNTIRTQVRGVLEKTGCTRQAEVVALLAGIACRG